MADPVGDSIDFKPNGTITITIGGKGWRLRRPLHGEIVKLTDLGVEVDEREQVLADEANAENRAAWDARSEPLGPLAPALRARFNRRRAEDRMAWVLEVMRMLCDRGEFPTVDEMPEWMGNAELGISLFSHWRTVPLAPSSSARA